ncbi:hypothetical protein ACR30L_12030 [Psychromonas sp. PT13]|uniref:hypothetical protein n=1 Tax=Psychromonas sp. PT13 TaxID=3439547 RepID=UPI003EB8EF18
MSVKPEDILAAAEWMIEGSPSEVKIRASISSSYYSMYHKVLSILSNEPIRYEGKGIHAALIKYLQTDAKHDENYDFMTLKSLAYMLKQEKDSRVIADYKLCSILEIQNAKNSCITAKRFFEKCDKLIESNSTSVAV